MKEVTELLRDLAKELGTTVDFMWGILIKQAFVDAIAIMIFTIMVITSGIILYFKHKKFSEPVKENYSRNTYEDSDFVTPLMTLASAIWLGCFIVNLTLIPDMVNGFFNPGYYALNKILQLIN